MKKHDVTGRLFDIQKFSIIDGPGIRTTVFFKGCNLRCKWCHNPESQLFESQMFLRSRRCTSCGKCREVCQNDLRKCTLCGKCTLYCPQHAREIVGREYTADEAMEFILIDKPFYDASGGGVTFSGGECMLQADFLCTLLSRCREAGVHTAVDTAGHVQWEVFERVIPYTDLFLYDLKCVSDTLHTEGTGVSNQLILSNLQKLAALEKCRVTVRIPVIPGFNADAAELRRMAAFLRDTGIESLELLPYHRMGEQKYADLGRETEGYSVPSEKEMNSYKSIFGLSQKGV